MTKAIVWVVYGDKAKQACGRSMESVSFWNTDPQQVITHDIGAVSNKIASRHAKTTLLKRTRPIMCCTWTPTRLSDRR